MNRTAFASRLFCIALVIAIDSPFAAPAACPVLTLIRKNYCPATALETRLSQTIYWSVREKEEKNSGSVVLAPDDCFRVMVGNETWVSNGITLWTFNSKANQVVVRKLADVDPALLPTHLFAAYFATLPFREQKRAEGGTTELLWKSDSVAKTGPPYTSIRIWATANGCITKCVLTDRSDNLFTYSFTGTVFGKKAPKETFDFVIPKSARVVDSQK